MAVREILLYPDPMLKQVSAEISEFGPTLEEMLRDLEDTLEASSGCVGIAAPQVGILHRIVLIDASRNRKPVTNQGRLFLINPVIEYAEGSVLGREGCLSLPHLTANVMRAERISVKYIDRSGTPKQIDSHDFEARVIQHEMDHLEGLLFLDRVSSLKTDVFRRKRY